MFRFVHTVVYRTLGIALSPDEPERELMNDNRAAVRMIVTIDPDPYCNHADVGLAATYLLLTGEFASDNPTLDEQLEAEVAKIRDERRARTSAGMYLILEYSGTVEEFTPEVQRETDRFIISFDGFDPQVMRAESRPRFARAILALSIAAEQPIGTEMVSNAITLFRADGKPIYPRTFTAGSSTAWVSTPPATLNSVAEWFRAVDDHSELDRIYQLFSSSIELQDRLRSFLAIWTALEIFLNKTFGDYERTLFIELNRGERPAVWRQYLDRVQEVMRDKYRLTDKFFVISTILDPTAADADYLEFQRAKELRDRLAHGQDVNEADLPLGPIRRLVRKYVQLHLHRRPPQS